MVTAVLALKTGEIHVGLAGSPTAMAIVQADLANRLDLHRGIVEALDQLLIDVSHTHVLVTEPPLLSIPIKKSIADILLIHIRVSSYVFVPQSVCCLLGRGLRSGIVVAADLDPACQEISVVPVYDCREMTPLISVTTKDGNGLDDDDQPLKDVIDRIGKKLGKDCVKRVTDPKRLIVNDPQGGFVGASIVASTSSATVWPVMSREKYQSGQRNVYDVLFDWPQSHRRDVVAYFHPTYH